MASEFLTLFTDASFCHQTRCSGWGAWAIRDDWERSDLFGDSIPIPMNSTNDAETYAIFAALETLRERGDLKDIEKFSIQSDNVHALGVLRTSISRAIVSSKKFTKAHISASLNLTSIQRDAAKAIKDMIGNRPIYLKHVKGHTGEGTGRSWVNARCDEIAGRHMREARERHRGLARQGVV